VKTVREAIGKFPLVAIGGINSENFRSVLLAGANSAAVISDIISAGERIGEKLRKYDFE
jgi:thiamine monophosphate synthase